MTAKIIKFKRQKDPTQEIVIDANAVTDYLDEFSERYQAVTKELNDDIESIKRRKAELVSNRGYREVSS